MALEDLPSPGEIPEPKLAFDKKAPYVLLAFGLQGFAEANKNIAWTLEYPNPTLVAQLVKRGDTPELVTDNVTLRWEMDPRTTSEAGRSAPRGGAMRLADDGLAFSAAVPVSDTQTDGLRNPYPFVRVTAHDADGNALAAGGAVLAVAPEFGCALCHADAEYAILKVHDRHQGTALETTARQGEAVKCRACHTGLAGDAAKPLPGAGMSVSAAIHGWHAAYMTNRGADACLSCHTGLGRTAQKDAATADAAQKSSGAPLPLLARDFHVTKGLTCVTCHGVLEDHALALLKAEEQAGQAVAAKAMAQLAPREVKSLSDIKPRLPWAQLPDCAACHDFSARPKPDDVSGFDKWAENAAKRYSARTDDIAVMRCPTCHGAPHALYPAKNPLGKERDNLPPLQYQSLARTIGAAGNCALCHMQDMDESAHHPLVE
jgi:hypothetical protein